VLFLQSFKAAAAEGAALEFKLHLLADTVPALRNYAHQQNHPSQLFGSRVFYVDPLVR
jgi:hypothetical protein